MSAGAAAWAFLKASGNRFVVQNANRILERTGLDKMAIGLFGRLLQTKPEPYLQNAIVAGGHNGRAPEFRARFARNGKNGAFYLEYRTAFGGLGPTGWTMPRKIEVARQDRFAVGEMVEFTIISRFEHEREGVSWFFGLRPDLLQGHPRDTLNPDAHFQGRVTFLADDDTTQHCYFIVATSDRASMPTVTGEHMFSHIYEWEGRPMPNADPEALFKH
jgi:hypothetical protein